MKISILISALVLIFAACWKKPLTINRLPLTRPFSQPTVDSMLLVWKMKLNSSIIASPTLFYNYLIVPTGHQQIHFIDIYSGKKIRTIKFNGSPDPNMALYEPFLFFTVGRTYKDNFFIYELPTIKKIMSTKEHPPIIGIEIMDTVIALIDNKNYLKLLDIREKKHQTIGQLPGRPLFPMIKRNNLLIANTENGYILYIDIFQRKFHIAGTLATFFQLPLQAVDDNFYAINGNGVFYQWTLENIENPICDSLPHPARQIIQLNSREALLLLNNNQIIQKNTQGARAIYQGKSEIVGVQTIDSVRLLITYLDGSLEIFNRTEGRVKWSVRLKGMIHAMPTRHGNEWYVGTSHRWLYCFRQE